MTESDYKSPITTREVLSLKDLGIQEQFITPNNITMESEKYICIREISPEDGCIVIIDMTMPMQPLRLPLSAVDSALMNPQHPILAIIVQAEIDETTQDQLQIFNVEEKTTMKSYNMAEKVVFWKWITPKLLGLVTQTTVYHWSTEGSSEPVKMFDRSASLATSDIISYQCDPSEKWFALTGTWRDPLFSGKMQLFSVEEQNSQEFDALVSAFTTLKVKENDAPSTLICFATGSVSYEKERYIIQLNVIELGAQPGKVGFAEKKGDFRIGHWPGLPLALQISEKYHMVSVITKRGLASLHDLETASSIFCYNISDYYLILTTESKSKGGFYSINEGGQVLLTYVNKDNIHNEKIPLKDSQITQHEQCLHKLLVTKEKLYHLQEVQQKMISEMEGLMKQNAELQNERAEIVMDLEEGTERQPGLKRSEFIKLKKLVQKMHKEIEEVKEEKAKLQNERDKTVTHMEELLQVETKEQGEIKEQLTSKMTELNNYRKSQEEMMNEIEGLKKQNTEITNERDDLKWRLFKEELAASSNPLEVKLTDFTLLQLRKVTNDFSSSLKIGEGGLGLVYKAIDGQPFAIKIPRGESYHGNRAFIQEVEILSKYRHPNIVKLLGTCQEAQALIYELMPNGSLYDILSNKERAKALTWKTRICIAFDVCRALIFIHSGKAPDTIVHGDLKSANILLDSNYTAKIHDFGISRHLHQTDKTYTPHHYTEYQKGSYGYVDPEFVDTGEMTTKFDVYSFGIVLLELVTGINPEFGRFRKSVEDAFQNGKIFEDATIGDWPPKEAKKMMRLGLRCSERLRENRPDLDKNVAAEIEAMQRASRRYP